MLCLMTGYLARNCENGEYDAAIYLCTVGFILHKSEVYMCLHIAKQIKTS